MSNTLDMSEIDELLENLGTTDHKDGSRRNTRIQSVKSSTTGYDMSDLDDLLSEWEEPKSSRSSTKSSADLTFKPDVSSALDLEAELNAALDFIPSVSPTTGPKNPTNNDGSRRRTQILESHGQTKNHQMDNLLKDLSFAKSFEKPAQPIAINPSIPKNPKPTVSNAKASSPKINRQPTNPPASVFSAQPMTARIESSSYSSPSVSTPVSKVRRPGFCPTCDKPTTSGPGVITAMGVDWHKDCFKCNFCKQVLKDGKHMAYKDEPYHHACVVQMSKQQKAGITKQGGTATKRIDCPGCGAEVLGERVILGNGSQMHKHCFKCTTCKSPLTLEDLFSDPNGKPICKACAQRLN